MTACEVCGRPLAGDGLAGGAVHGACFARRAPQDALVVAVAAMALVAAPAIVLWAG
jgi:hypothetical protein